VGRVRNAINARLEETSFLAGATASAGVLAVTGSAIALAVSLGGSHADVASAPAAHVAPHSSAPVVPATASPLLSPSHTQPKPKPKPKPKATSAPRPPVEAAAYTPRQEPHRWGSYQGRHRMGHAGGWFGGHGSWGHSGHWGGHGGRHFP
jgi:pilus assembly protein FimV